MATERNIWTETNSNTAPYARLEEKQAAWDEYQIAMSAEDRAAMDADFGLYEAVSGMFFGAKSPEELEKYANMGLDELTRLAAEIHAARQEKMRQEP